MAEKWWKEVKHNGISTKVQAGKIHKTKRLIAIIKNGKHWFVMQCNRKYQKFEFFDFQTKRLFWINANLVSFLWFVQNRGEKNHNTNTTFKWNQTYKEIDSLTETSVPYWHYSVSNEVYTIQRPSTFGPTWSSLRTYVLNNAWLNNNFTYVLLIF